MVAVSSSDMGINVFHMDTLAVKFPPSLVNWGMADLDFINGGESGRFCCYADCV